MNYPGKVALQQRVLPEYRIPFFEKLAEACDDGLSVYAGEPLPEESIKIGQEIKKAHYFYADNNHFRLRARGLTFKD